MLTKEYIVVHDDETENPIIMFKKHIETIRKAPSGKTFISTIGGQHIYTAEQYENIIELLNDVSRETPPENNLIGESKKNHSLSLEAWVSELLDDIKRASEKGENYNLHLEQPYVNSIATAYHNTEWIEIY